MPALPLTCHRNTPTDAVSGIAVDARRTADGWLHFRYMLRGDIARLALPAPAAAQHTDELWRHTCFEAFISAADESAYVECNFSPSGAWASYRFTRYRQSMTAIVPHDPPHLALRTESASLVLEARLRFGEFAERALRIGLTAVIEDKAGNLSYWALRHPRTRPNPRPDFHHRGGFILRLAAPSAPITENQT